jgi:hypothetical protein
MCLAMANRAQAAEEGFEFGARLGFGLPLGSSSGVLGDDFTKLFNSMIPLWFDLGYRATPHVYVGAYFMYGFGFLSSGLNNMGCQSSGVSCDIHDIRFGADLHYHVTPGGPLDPWVGVGFGYEWVGFSASGGSASAGVGISGWEFINAQVGFDYRVSNNFSIGPFSAITVAEFENASVNGAMSTSGSIANKALHEWLIFGVRAIFDVTPPSRSPPPPMPDPTPDSTPDSTPGSSWDS